VDRSAAGEGELMQVVVLVELSPWPTLTLVVSLDAIFLSAFVMIGQNRSELPAGNG
jgi:uncharacterized membrane protein